MSYRAKDYKIGEINLLLQAIRNEGYYLNITKSKMYEKTTSTLVARGLFEKLNPYHFKLTLEGQNVAEFLQQREITNQENAKKKKSQT